MPKWFLHCVLALMALTLASAADAGAPASRSGHKDGRDTYMVELSAPPVALYRGGVPGLGATDPRSRGERKLDADSPDSRRYVDHLLKQQGEALAAMRGQIGREVAAIHQYTNAFDGMALDLSREEADRISRMPGVRRVRRAQKLHLLSDAGPAWTGAPGIWGGTQTGGLPGTKGEGMVIGIVDSGINMDHPAFADVGGDGYNHTNPRGAGNYVGWCNPSNPNYNPALPCNDKLIGVWSYPYTGNNPEDDYGHGTQLAAVAAGNQLSAPVTPTLTRTISGVAPHANLVSYDVCSSYYYCYESDVLAGVDQAVADGVDVLNLSLAGYDYDPWQDAVPQALLAAREAGILVAAGAGNGGPWEESIYPPANSPWVIAVGASSHNRRFVTSMVGVSGGSTTPPTLYGSSLTAALGTAAIVSAGAYGDSFCSGPFAAGLFTGKIVVCEVSPYYDGTYEVGVVKTAGAAGVVLVDYYDNGDETVTRSYSLPAVRLDESAGWTLLNWLGSGSGHTAQITATAAQVTSSNGDLLADFSGRGPSFPGGLVRPDLLAPGSGIFAPSSDPDDYAIRSGTSYSSAFAAGAAALLLDLHPDWTPGEVQSALMTTAVATGIRHAADGTSATSPLEIGAGRLNLGAAGRAGLVLDETVAHFTQADPANGGVPGNLNLASLSQYQCTLGCSWTRAVRSTLSSTSHWTAAVSPPAGTSATVTPSSFTLGPGATQTLQISISGPPSSLGWSFGALTLTETGSQAPTARLPIATRWVGQLKLTVTKQGNGTGKVTSVPAGIDCGPTCAAPFPDDDTYVKLTATADPGSAFVGWSGWYCDGPENPCSFPLWSNQQVTAWFNVQPPDVALANRTGVKDAINSPVAGGSWKYYFADLGSGNDQLVVDVFDLNGDATLYVRSATKPDWSHYNCVDYDYYGLPNRRCVISAPTAGRWWIGVNGEQTGMIQYSVRASWGSNADQALQNGVPVGDFVTNAQPGAGWKYYYVDLTGGSSELVVDLKDLSADADLFVRRGAKPDRSNYDCISAAVGPGSERCTMSNPESGRWWIGVNNFTAGTVTYTAQAAWTATAGADFHTVTPCRLVDTRTSYPLQGGQTRSFLAGGSCGIPLTAKAVVVNVTVLGGTGSGLLTLYPDNLSVPSTSAINFLAGQTRANNGVYRLSTDGQGRLGVYAAVSGNGIVHMILDVSGYYE